MIESDNAKDGPLSGFHSCGSANMLGGSGASNLAAPGVGWEEQLLHFFFLALEEVSYFVLMIDFSYSRMCNLMLNHSYKFRRNVYASMFFV